jgi:WhiB family redox-sensing transcriptional regulator
MVIPRQTFGITSITTPSLVMRDPAEVFDLHGADPGELVAALDEAGDRVRAMVASWRASWTQDAACIGVDVAVFFPGPGATTKEAQAICSRCSVIEPCRDEAVADPSLDHGIRGGLSARQRKKLRSEATS